MAKILIVEDDTSLAGSLRKALAREGHVVEAVTSAEAGLERCKDGGFDVVVTDLQLPGGSGLELIGNIHIQTPHLPVILMTAYHTPQNAIEASKLGAFDYILKGAEMTEQLVELIGKAVKTGPPPPEQDATAKQDLARETLIGDSRVMQAVYKEIGRVAAVSVTVLIRGETGTGKELVARAIHKHSNRSDKPFVTMNCVAIPETLLESELFGHERGSFTGADSRRIGRFEQANGGTLFLDEIGDMSMGTQAKLLRVLQEKSFNRLGGREDISVDVRVLAATHRDLETAIKEKEFREDLYYRLNVATITLPPLRDRREDIPALATYFVLRHGGEMGLLNPTISADATAFLATQEWRGNVRELENVVRKALLLARRYLQAQRTVTIIGLEDVRAALAKSEIPRPASNQPLSAYVSDLLTRAERGELVDAQSAFMAVAERELYAQAIRLAAGNQAKAAKWLGVSRPTMREKLLQHGLHPDSDSSASTR